MWAAVSSSGFGWFSDVFRLAYMQRALLELTALSLVSGIVGFVVSIRRLGFFVDTLTHAMFPGLAIAYALGAPLLTGSIAGAAVGAVAVAGLSQLRRIGNDAALAVVGAVMYAIGVAVVSRRRTFTADLDSVLFGRFLTISNDDVIATMFVAVTCLAIWWKFRWQIVRRAFDASQTRNLRDQIVLDILITSMIAGAMAVCSIAVGTLLTVALLLIPAAIARLTTTNRLRAMMIGAAATLGSGYVALSLTRWLSISHGSRVAPAPVISSTLLAVWLVVFIAQQVANRVKSRRLIYLDDEVGPQASFETATL